MNAPSRSAIEISDPFTRRLLTKYLERRQSDLMRLRKDLVEENYAAIELNGHNLSGSGAAYGLEEVSIIGSKLEQAAKARKAVRVTELIDALEEFLINVTVN